jgi:hypothetical protein
MCWAGTNWITVAQNSGRQQAFVSTAMNIVCGEFLDSCETVGFSNRTLHHKVS